MSAFTLLHDDGANIIVSANRGKKTAFFSRRFLSRIKAEHFADRLGQTGHNVFVRHAVHDGVMKDTKSPVLDIPHFVASRTFVLDIDAGDKKTAAYPTLKVAAAEVGKALTALRASINIPLPNLMLQTGGGLHIAWVLDTLIPAEEWRRLTGIFNLLALEAGLKIDLGMAPMDKGVRVCGPHFFNLNYPELGPLPTKVLRDEPKRLDAALWRKMLEPFALRSVPTPSPTYPGGKSEDRDEFSAKSAGFKLDIDFIADKCETLSDALATGGAGHTYPMWTALLRLVSRNGDEAMGRAYAHEISKSHVDYDNNSTDAKFDSFRNSGKGYPTCAEIAKLDGTKCPSCAFYNTINSPGGIQGKAAAVKQASQWAAPALTADADKLPFPYYNTSAGVYRTSSEVDVPDPKVWRNVEITNVAVTVDNHGINVQGDKYLTFEYRLLSGKEREKDVTKIVFPINCMNEPQQRSKIFSEHQVVVDDNDKKGVASMMRSWLETLQARGQVQPQYTRLGWDAKNELFVLGTRVYHPNGTISEGAGRNTEQQHFNAAGDVATYNAAVSSIMLNEVRPEAHAMIAASFAAPFVRLLGSSSMSLNFYSVGSGYGKTTLSQVAASIWGRPQSSTAAVDDTQNALIARVSQLNNLPMFFDELRIANPHEYLPQVLFRLTHGVSKRRLNSESKAQEIADWRTLLVFSTNFSFAGLVGGKASQGDAAAARYLDFVMPPLPQGSVTRAMMIMQEREVLGHTYGHPGVAFVKLLVKHRATYVKLITKLGDQLMQLASLDHNDVSGRNHAVAGAAMIVASAIVQKAGVFPLDHKLVEAAIKGAILAGKGGRKEAQQTVMPLDILTRYLKEREAHRIITSAGAKRQRTVDGMIQPRLPLAYEIDRSGREILVQLSPLTAWLVEQRFNVSATMADLSAIYKQEERSLGRGTPYASPKLAVMIVPAEGIYAPLVEQFSIT
jgi:hypothetical protein